MDKIRRRIGRVDTSYGRCRDAHGSDKIRRPAVKSANPIRRGADRYDPIQRVGGLDSGFESDIRPSPPTPIPYTPSPTRFPQPYLRRCHHLQAFKDLWKFAVLLSASSFKSSLPRRSQQIIKARLCLVVASSLHRRQFISARFFVEARVIGLESRRSSRQGFQSRRSSRIGFQPFFVLQGKGFGSPFFSSLVEISSLKMHIAGSGSGNNMIVGDFNNNQSQYLEKNEEEIKKLKKEVEQLKENNIRASEPGNLIEITAISDPIRVQPYYLLLSGEDRLLCFSEALNARITNTNLMQREGHDAVAVTEDVEGATNLANSKRRADLANGGRFLWLRSLRA
ncbi:hypothetical protein PIB30_015107 [Stylosanthes scabra]|uniref:Uncharacterized protein n=1 Tax=Stylosanthes scabra TaxID=79078 RepID=A0ABU6R783_9FABA|nr:hypothetical protein [Stylosanthes scabra]